MTQYICFQVAGGSYAVPLTPVAQVLRCENLVPLPASPPFIAGLLNLGGEVVPVLDLRSLFGLDPAEPTRRSRVLIAEHNSRKHGLLVDSVQAILALESSSIATVGAGASGPKAELTAGVAKVRDSLVLILDLPRLLQAEGAR